MRGRPPLLPRDPAGETWLGAVIAVLCFIACLAAAATTASDRAAAGWARALRDEATVLVRPRVGETGDAAAARAAETLAGVDGVEEARALPREAAEDLLRPWVGEAALGDLPIPHAVVVRLNPEVPASVPVMRRALAEAGLDAELDDGAAWRTQVERAAATVSALALTAFLLVALAAGAAVVYATRAGLQARRAVIETLSLSGASDGRIAWLFMRRLGLLAAGSGAAGTLGAALIVGGMAAAGGARGLTPALPLVWTDLLILSPCPLIAATVALVAARVAAMAALGGEARRR